MNRIFIAAIGGFLSFHAAPAAAQSSFSSVLFSDGGPAQTYSGARLFSEDGYQYRLRAFGCEFEVEYPIQGSRHIDGFATGAAEEMSDPASSFATLFPGRVELAGRLVRGRVREIGSYRPQDFTCDTNRSLSVIAIIANADPEPKISVAIIQFPVVTTASGDLDVPDHPRPPFFAFGMNEDFFTPGQADRAWGTAGAITLALLRILGGR